LSLGWNFKIKFWNSDSCVFRFDYRSIHSCYVCHFQDILYSKVGKFSAKLYFSILQTTIIAVEWWKDYFFEHRYFSIHEFSFTHLMTFHAEWFDFVWGYSCFKINNKFFNISWLVEIFSFWSFGVFCFFNMGWLHRLVVWSVSLFWF